VRKDGSQDEQGGGRHRDVRRRDDQNERQGNREDDQEIS